MKLPTAVLGAGALGLTVAYRLGQQGDEVIVLDREPLPGALGARHPRTLNDMAGYPCRIPDIRADRPRNGGSIGESLSVRSDAEQAAWSFLAPAPIYPHH